MLGYHPRIDISVVVIFYSHRTSSLKDKSIINTWMTLKHLQIHLFNNWSYDTCFTYAWHLFYRMRENNPGQVISKPDSSSRNSPTVIRVTSAYTLTARSHSNQPANGRSDPTDSTGLLKLQACAWKARCPDLCLWHSTRTLQPNSSLTQLHRCRRSSCSRGLCFFYLHRGSCGRGLIHVRL